MQITHKVSFDPRHVYDDTNDIETNCTTITFENYGETDCDVFFADTDHAHLDGSGLRIPAGTSITLGGRLDSILTDLLDLAFTRLDLVRGVNIIRETYSMLT